MIHFNTNSKYLIDMLFGNVVYAEASLVAASVAINSLGADPASTDGLVTTSALIGLVVVAGVLPLKRLMLPLMVDPMAREVDLAKLVASEATLLKIPAAPMMALDRIPVFSF